MPNYPRVTTYFFLSLLLAAAAPAVAQTATPEHSVARRWNEQLLEAIRNDFARPVVHARNLYHSSAAMYDCWSLITGQGAPALMGTFQNGFYLNIDRDSIPDYTDRAAAIDEAISYAAYRLLRHRYRRAPGRTGIEGRAALLMAEMGYDTAVVDLNYGSRGPAQLGNYVAHKIIEFGLQDGANEAMDYDNLEYPDGPNGPLVLDRPFSIFQLRDPNQWQALAFPGVIIDQSGNVLDGNLQTFLGAEWGRVHPFALSEADRTDPTPENPIFGNSPVYHDPGPPPLFSRTDTQSLNQYRFGFEMVLKWSSHLDPRDSVLWDISPGARGNAPRPYPRDFADYPAFYNEREGGQAGNGRPVNPRTGQPYAPNIVPRGDYTRVLAEFWADGPASETPPGHWFAILNEKVLDHPDFRRRVGGRGPELSPLEYDLKVYLTLGGAMHDAAITAWSIKAKYNYVRPISAIRYLAVQGQATVPENRFYDTLGIRLDPGYIELLDSAEQIVNATTLGTVRARAWIGNESILDPDVDQAGVDWINPSLWEPYQRPTFVTPNFAGYVSGHSLYSSAAATVLERITGDEYFPGGLAEFLAPANEFLVFEEGPSVDVRLQWATYRDASDETSLSRIWGGIHPPADDLPARIIGLEVGGDAYARALSIFDGTLVSVPGVPAGRELLAYPNPLRAGQPLELVLDTVGGTPDHLWVFDAAGRRVARVDCAGGRGRVLTAGFAPGLYVVAGAGRRFAAKFIVLP